MKGIEDKALVLGGCEDVIVAVMPEGVGRQKIPCGAALLKEVIVAVMPEGVGRGAGGTVVAKSASGDRRRDAGRRWAP